jgi:hypothetical protein
MVISFDGFAEAIIGWCSIKNNQFKQYWPLKGGWEQWVQAEVAAYIISQDTRFDIQREQHIYRQYQKKVDWVCNGLNPDVSTWIAIELKCQSHGNANNFIDEVRKDIAKIQPLNIDPAFRIAQTGVMAIYFEEKSQAWLKDDGFIEVFVNKEVGCAIKKI